MKKLTFVVLIETNDTMILMTDPKGVVIGFNELGKALEYFEGSYRNAHRRSYEGSMSACVSFILFRPSIVHFESTEEMAAALLDGPPYHSVRIGSVAGSVQGLVCAAKAKKLFEEGTKPRLI